MRKGRGLVVCVSNRREIARDQLEAILWSCRRSTVVMVTPGPETLGPERDEENYSVVFSRLPQKKHLSGFMGNEGIADAIARDVPFDSVLLLDDDCLPIGVGLDAFGVAALETEDADLFGVRDRVDYRPSWETWRELFTFWLPEAAGWSPRAAGVFYPAVWLSRAFAFELAIRGLLVPPHAEKWGLWPDVYIGWMCAALGFRLGFRGGMGAAAEPPLYLDHAKRMENAPSPLILREDFLAYHSVRAVPAISETEIRRFYRERRLFVDERSETCENSKSIG